MSLSGSANHELGNALGIALVDPSRLPGRVGVWVRFGVDGLKGENIGERKSKAGKLADMPLEIRYNESSKQMRQRNHHSKQ